jgi:ribosome-associated translation inhibitor RaiA
MITLPLLAGHSIWIDVSASRPISLSPYQDMTTPAPLFMSSASAFALASLAVSRTMRGAPNILCISTPIEIDAAEAIGYLLRSLVIEPASIFLKVSHMDSPLTISFDGIDHSDAIEARIREEARKLEQFHDHIVSARVVVSRPQRRHHKGDVYQVRIRLVVPEAADIVVTREPGVDGAHEDMYICIRDAFKAARRQLQDAKDH